MDAPLSADEFVLFVSRKPGDRLDGKHGLSVAVLPKDGRNSKAYINIRPRLPGEPARWNISFHGDDSRPVKVEPRHDHFARIVVAGASGSGKSTWIGDYVQRYTAVDPQPTYILSKVEEDPPLDAIEDSHRVNPMDLHESAMEEGPMGSAELANSVFISDDIETLQPPPVKQTAAALRDDILETGRHHDVTQLHALHTLIGSGGRNRLLLGESTAVVLFPRSSGMHSGTHFMKAYMGMSPKAARAILTLPSRWIYVGRLYPMYVVWEHGVRLI